MKIDGENGTYGWSSEYNQGGAGVLFITMGGHYAAFVYQGREKFLHYGVRVLLFI